MRTVAGILASSALIACALAWWWRGEAIEAKAATTTAKAQIAILESDIETRNAASRELERQTRAAQARVRNEVAAARRLAADAERRAANSSAAALGPTPAGAGCDTAWIEIEGRVPQ